MEVKVKKGQIECLIWSICSSHVERIFRGGHKMNNSLEGWHTKVKKNAGMHHLNIFEIVKLYKKEQTSTEVESRQLMAVGTGRRQAPRQRNVGKKLESKPL